MFYWNTVSNNLPTVSWLRLRAEDGRMVSWQGRELWCINLFEKNRLTVLVSDFSSCKGQLAFLPLEYVWLLCDVSIPQVIAHISALFLTVCLDLSEPSDLRGDVRYSFVGAWVGDDFFGFCRSTKEKVSAFALWQKQTIYAFIRDALRYFYLIMNLTFCITKSFIWAD